MGHTTLPGTPNTAPAVSAATAAEEAVHAFIAQWRGITVSELATSQCFVVSAGGLAQLLAFHMGLFQMGNTATILGAMLLMVALVDTASHWARRLLTR